MDGLNETAVYALLAPQLLWIKIQEVCAAILLALCVLMLLVGWIRHLSWRIRLCAVLPLVVSIVAATAAHALHDTYGYWVAFLNYWLPVSYPKAFQDHFLSEIANANQTALVLGWGVVSMTSLVLVLSLLGVWRLVVPGQRRYLSSSLVAES